MRGVANKVPPGSRHLARQDSSELLKIKKAYEDEITDLRCVLLRTPSGPSHSVPPSSPSHLHTHLHVYSNLKLVRERGRERENLSSCQDEHTHTHTELIIHTKHTSNPHTHHKSVCTSISTMCSHNRILQSCVYVSSRFSLYNVRICLWSRVKVVSWIWAIGCGHGS